MYHLVPIAQLLALWGLARAEESMLQKWGSPMSYDELDGRDALIKQHFKNRKDLVAEVRRADDVLAKYTTNPWEPAYYSQFDDFLPADPEAFQSAIHGIPGFRHWSVPVTMVDRHEGVAAWYEQLSGGTLEITEVPRDDGTSEFWLGIKEP